MIPSSLAAIHRGFAFYVAFPKRSIPDLWQKEAVRCNKEKILLCQGYGGTSVVVQAPTGSGKTYINLHQ